MPSYVGHILVIDEEAKGGKREDVEEKFLAAFTAAHIPNKPTYDIHVKTATHDLSSNLTGNRMSGNHTPGQYRVKHVNVDYSLAVIDVATTPIKSDSDEYVHNPLKQHHGIEKGDPLGKTKAMLYFLKPNPQGLPVYLTGATGEQVAELELYIKENKLGHTLANTGLSMKELCDNSGRLHEICSAVYKTAPDIGRAHPAIQVVSDEKMVAKIQDRKLVEAIQEMKKDGSAPLFIVTEDDPEVRKSIAAQVFGMKSSDPELLKLHEAEIGGKKIKVFFADNDRAVEDLQSKMWEVEDTQQIAGAILDIEYFEQPGTVVAKPLGLERAEELKRKVQGGVNNIAIHSSLVGTKETDLKLQGDELLGVKPFKKHDYAGLRNFVETTLGLAPAVGKEEGVSTGALPGGPDLSKVKQTGKS